MIAFDIQKQKIAKSQQEIDREKRYRDQQTERVTMPFKYSCFISYCHSENPLMKNFVDEIQGAFDSCLEPFFDQKVYIDKSRLKGGYKFNEELSRAICQSLCMIVIYIPKYENHSYCLREYLAMYRLEKKRLDLLENKSSDMGMIIPIVFRDKMNSSVGIISKIKSEIQYCDFSKFSLSNMKINNYPECIEKIDQIAQEIYSLYQQFEEWGIDPCCDCNSFCLPSEYDAMLWKNKNFTDLPKLGENLPFEDGALWKNTYKTPFIGREE